MTIGSTGSPAASFSSTRESRRSFSFSTPMMEPQLSQPMLSIARGLDYYTRTLFEVKAATAKLGAGDTIAGGGRYDNTIGAYGESRPAAGFAFFLERAMAAAAAVHGHFVDIRQFA